MLYAFLHRAAFHLFDGPSSGPDPTVKKKKEKKEKLKYLLPFGNVNNLFIIQIGTSQKKVKI